MVASSYGNFKWTSVTRLERGIIFLSYCYPERIIYDDTCHLKKCCLNPVQNEMTAVSKRLRKMYMVVDKLHFRNHVHRWYKANCNPHDRDKLHRVSVCLSLCIQMSFRFGEWGLGEGEARKHMIVKETGQIATTGACGGRKLAQICNIFHEGISDSLAWKRIRGRLSIIL